jgi:hypothetical protein
LSEFLFSIHAASGQEHRVGSAHNRSPLRVFLTKPLVIVHLAGIASG